MPLTSVRRAKPLPGLACLLVSLACSDVSSGPPGNNPNDLSTTPCEPGTAVACTCPDNSPSQRACNPQGTGFDACYCVPSPGAGGGPPSGAGGNPMAGGPGAGGTPAPGAGGAAPGAGGTTFVTGPDDLPCNVKELLAERCWECHGGSAPSFGAPMLLTSSVNFKATASDGTRSVAQAVTARIRDEVKPMPQLPNPRLTAEEMAVLDDYIAAGTPAGSCDDIPIDPPDAGAPDPDSGPPDDPNVTCYELTAHAPGADTPFDVPQSPDLYQCFAFAPPWGDKQVQITSARKIIDNTNVIHHWLLYNNTGAVTDGQTASCSGAHPDAQLMAGWAPGGSDLELPSDVGLTAPGLGWTLEIHYNNSQGQQFDASGVEVCVTDVPRANTAAYHWLGTEAIILPGGGDAVGTCVPINTGPVTILSSWPHMHLQGRHMKTVINRASGGQDVLIDQAFDFDTQITYATPAVVNPGDTLTTTCTYGGPAIFGQGTNEEMCYNFVLAYPAGQLSTGISALRINNCTGF